LIKKTYLILRTATIFTIAIATAAAFLVSSSEVVQYLAQKYLKENSIEYTKVEGSILEGVVFYDLKYADAVTIKTLKVKYNLLMLFLPVMRIQEIKTKDMYINVKNLAALSGEGDKKSILPFYIAKLQLKDTQVVLNNDSVSFTLNASNVHYHDALDVKKLSVLLLSSYGEINIDANIVSDRLKGNASFEAENSFSKKYLNFVQGIPEKLIFDLDATQQKIFLRSHVNKITLVEDQNLSINDMDIGLTYFVEENYFKLNSEYKLSYKDFESTLNQSAIFTVDGCYSSELNATLIKQPIELPFKSLSADIAGNSNNIVVNLKAGPLKLDLHSQDYNSFIVHGESKHLSLSFMQNLPDILKKNVISISSDAVVNISPFSVIGTFFADGLYCKSSGDFEADKEGSLIQATINPKPESDIWKKYPIDKFSPLKVIFYKQNQADVLYLHANLFDLTLFKKDTQLMGWGSLGSSTFEAKGSVGAEQETKIELTANVASVNTLLSELGLFSADEKIFYDAQIGINTTVTMAKNIKVKTRLYVPWYTLTLDDKKSYSGKNGFVESTIIDRKIVIDSYSTDFMGHKIYSKKPSILSIDDNGTIEFKEFWIYDNLLLKGTVNPLHKKGNLRLKSDRFKYEGAEGNVTIKADIRASFEENGTQNLEGTVTLLDGVVTYLPSEDYSVSDSDVIIIQEIKPHDESKRFVSIHIDSIKPIRYKVKDIDIKFTPDFTILKENDSKFKLYGMVTIDQGEISGGGKEFTFDKSEIYFYGGDPINPYLNLNLHHYTINYIDIEIFITNTLASPVLIFSSKPAMSQNDIMSYILFGEPASSLFEGSAEGTTKASVNSLLLGTGLKQIFNEAAGVKVDTLNILTNKEGTLGYEIGVRFSKQIRMVYTNDAISSVILQYSLSKSVRIDVDVNEAGQGVSIIYIKDFKDF
jgi:translocation and assembly module TamB